VTIWSHVKSNGGEADDTPGEREIAALVAEHRACVMRAGELRDDVLRRIDDAFGAAGAYPSN
jgi:hypothetical protein